MHIVLVRPEIAPNTGNIIRLCANVGATLHLIEPLGFSLEDRLLRRGGLDYHELVDVHRHRLLGPLLGRLGTVGAIYGFSSAATRRYDEPAFAIDDTLVFGAERAGLSSAELEVIPAQGLLRIPMRPDNRSLNLANAVAITVYEVWRQLDFSGSAPSPGRPLTSETPGADPFDR